MEEPQPLIERIAAHNGPFKAKELAAILRVSVRSVYNAIENDRLLVIRIGTTIRLDPVYVAKWLRQRKVG
jgi:excisionase family DNA binding protein